MFQLDLAVTPKFVRPKLLLHPSVPKYLSGVNPRTIKGSEWWDEMRHEVYAENNFCCWACGVYQLDALYEQFLDAHEMYTYDYEKYEAYPGEVVGLCRACHWFIHWRRVPSLAIKKKVVLRGLKILVDAGIPLPYGQLRYARLCRWRGCWGWKEPYPELELQETVDETLLLSTKWVLVLDGVRYNMGGVVDEH